MRERPTALGFTSLLTLLAALHVARPADAASVARQCRRACREEIAACVDGGGHHRAWRKSVLGRWKQDGLTVCQGADGLNNGRRPKGSTTTTTTTTTTTQPGGTTTTTRSAVTTTTLARGGSPATGLHYAPNHNFDSSGSYAPARAGFNLADLSGVSTLNALPSGVKGLVWLGLCNGADSTFINAVKPFVGNPKLFGFYLMDEPDPTGQWNPLCPAANLLAESDWIHANVPGAKTFIALMNFGSTKSPTYANTYNPVIRISTCTDSIPIPVGASSAAATTTGSRSPWPPRRRQAFQSRASCPCIKPLAVATGPTMAVATTFSRPRARSNRFSPPGQRSSPRRCSTMRTPGGRRIRIRPWKARRLCRRCLPPTISKDQLGA